ncbi:hypothetical protein OPV22_011150 [Ensete ventricosum]|uniref:GBF-interacting protein 1 N-terminal domain-containing protein n=1 Tax=Ensete ventricosum TaxID=4639 RepID=A0AAV8RJV2_ENSVE|nr:hypothetical protein OPV22_011150 [Ensete ventricosum]
MHFAPRTHQLHATVGLVPFSLTLVRTASRFRCGVPRAWFPTPPISTEMVMGSGVDGGGQVVPLRIRKTIQSIKEIVGNHSDADIYAVLKETNMDPNETAQKLLNQDPFHEVKRKRDRKKEPTGYRGLADTRRHVEPNVQWAKSLASWDQNMHKGDYTRNSVPRVSRQFRIVKDNRVNQNAKEDVKQETLHQTSSYVHEKRARDPYDEELSVASNLDGYFLSADSSKSTGVPHNAKDSGPSGSQRPFLHEDAKATVSSSKAQDLQNSSHTHSKVASGNSVIVGAFRRDIGAVGAQRWFSDRCVSQSSVSLSSNPPLEKDVSPQTQPSGHLNTTSKSIQLNQGSALVRNLPSTSMSRSVPSSQHNSKQHQQFMGNQKAMQTNMEWKPKSTQKPMPGVVVSDSVSPSSADNLCITKLVDANELSEKLSKASISENQHVIIPQHLQVPESERTFLTFGSFETGFDSKGIITANQQSQSADEFTDEPSVSASASVPIFSTGDVFAAGHKDTLVVQDIGLVQSSSPPYSSKEQQLQNPQSLSGFSAYDNQNGYDVPFFRTVLEDNVHTQDLNSASEALNSLASSFSPLSSNGITQQQQLAHQPQQSLPQMYPQVHIPHYPNFVPYRHIFSPVYVPPIALPNYSSNPAYPHPSNGNNYLMMPGGSSQIPAASMKYAAAQYKPVPGGSPTAYASYNNSAGFTISSPGAVGSTAGPDDITRIKYKDHGLYMPNQQAETSDIWIQTQREHPSLQSAPYYNLSGQAPHAAFLAPHAGHGSFGPAAQISHVQYPGLYHPNQPASMAASPHQLVHHNVAPAIGGGVGVGVAAPGPGPGPQVGTYQQPQVGYYG